MHLGCLLPPPVPFDHSPVRSRTLAFRPSDELPGCRRVSKAQGDARINRSSYELGDNLSAERESEGCWMSPVSDRRVASQFVTDCIAYSLVHLEPLSKASDCLMYLQSYSVITPQTLIDNGTDAIPTHGRNHARIHRSTTSDGSSSRRYHKASPIVAERNTTELYEQESY